MQAPPSSAIIHSDNTASATTMPTPTPTPSDPGSRGSDYYNNIARKHSLNIGAVIGVSIGGLSLLCGFGILTMWMIKRRKATKEPTPRDFRTNENIEKPWGRLPAHRRSGGWSPQEMQGDCRQTEPFELAS